jgi:hypothetical protein
MMKNSTFTFRFTAAMLLVAVGSCSKSDTTYNGDTQLAPTDYYVRELPLPKTGLVLLDLKAYQQTTEYTCGPAAVLTLLRFNNRNADEMQLAKEMNTSSTCGTTPENMANWLMGNGFTVSWGENGTLDLIRENLSRKIPTLIEWSDWGGHWVVAVGYDTRNTDPLSDDVIIFADPYDRHDDREEGLNWFNAERFYYMWYDARLFGKLMTRIYITATPVK